MWAEVNSWTHNIEGLNAMLGHLEESFSVLGGDSTIIELPSQEIVVEQGRVAQRPLGKALSIVKRSAAALRVFLSCHYDTVYPPDKHRQVVMCDSENRLYGPGVSDAKGGLVIMLKALEAFESSSRADRLGWEILLNPDEEVGSPGSAPLLLDAARRNHVGLVFEPAFLDGTLVGARKGSGNFTAVFKGRAAHAGREPRAGRNAINAMAGFIVDLNAFPPDNEDLTINVGHVEGGGPVNVVPDLAMCRFNVRAADAEKQESFERHLSEIAERVGKLDGVTLEITGRFGRPPKPLDQATVSLLEKIALCGRELDLSINWRPSGGACDGNNLAAAGLPTVDSLGPRGGDIHSPREFVIPESLPERAKLTALLLMKLASGEIRL